MKQILVRQSLMNHRKTIDLARMLECERYTAAGIVIAVWLWALDHAPDGNLGVDFPAYAADVTGFPGNGGGLVDMLKLAGWIADVTDDSDDPTIPPYTYILSGWDDVNGPLSRFADSDK